jgi:glycosyltransferase involved in cell wall biosynthesis/GT2 family glycosyltransferase
LSGFLDRMEALGPELELLVVAEFPPPKGQWIPYRFDRSFSYNYRRCLASVRGRRIAYAGTVLQPRTPYFRIRMLAFAVAPLRTLIYNENLDHFMLRPGSAATIARHFAWRLRSAVKKQVRPGGWAYTWAWRFRHPSQLQRPLAFTRAALAGRILAIRKRAAAPPAPIDATASLPAGLSVVIPSRNGRDLLESLMPVLSRELSGMDAEVIVVDNGSGDGTSAYLGEHWPWVRLEISVDPLSFSRAVNRGIAAARYSHICLLNNDMIPHEGFFGPLLRAFEQVPGLFCATAQIFLPPGQRREETGKAVVRWPLPRQGNDFPVHCIEPLPGEDLTYVLYGSGGCSVYDAGKLRAIGGMGEVYEPAYVEDLDAGFRAWQRGWPTVFVSQSCVTHQHRATTSRYFTNDELDTVLEVNFLKFLARCVSTPEVFREIWKYAVRRLNTRAALEHHTPSLHALIAAAREGADWLEPPVSPAIAETVILGLGSGGIAVFPGRAAPKPICVLVASCYIPFPLSHGGAVRMYNLMKRAARDYSQVLITFVDELHTPPAELLEICVEVVQVRRIGSHHRPNTGRPDAVEDFDTPAFHGALQQTIRKWQPSVVQLEFTQMAQYAAEAGGAKTILVEHDITIDLYEQLYATSGDFETGDQLRRWRDFETDAWPAVDVVVTMSEKDRRAVLGARETVAIPNGVDLERFQPGDKPDGVSRLLFIGSFAHLPNLLALDFFLIDVWPLLGGDAPLLHVIAGARPEFFFERHRGRLRFGLDHPGIELEGFVSDVRPAYRRADAVIAPLLASAGTNIKIMEAMAMGKAVVSTPAGVNGLEIRPGEDIIVENDAAGFAAAISRVLHDADLRARLGAKARATAERVYNWDVIAEDQHRLYRRVVRS